MTRRDFFYNAAAPLVLGSLAPGLRADEPRSKMGIATTSYMTARRFHDTYEFLEHCHSLGAAGIQSQLNGDMARIRARAEEHNMYVEAIIGLPRGADTSLFERTVQNAKSAGALCVRANAGGRRYEDFSTLADYRLFAEHAKAALKAAIPICEKYKIPLALENHKDWTLEQITGLMKSYSSEYFGACMDFGNNIALLDDPMDVAEQLAPYAVTTHVKDMGVEGYGDGFLLSEMRLGEGFLDLARMMSLVHQARPKTNFNLEMITRDPLKVPCFTDGYWATFPDRSGLFLARTLRLVQKEAQPGKPLPRISQLSHDEQVAVEAENVRACLRYARQKLGM
ncbi:MAG: TIM barrel protein [Bryobacteraceae bacterium]